MALKPLMMVSIYFVSVCWFILLTLLFPDNGGPVRPTSRSARSVQAGGLVPVAAPAADGGLAIDRTVVSLANFVPEPVARGHVPARVSRSMTAGGAQPLVIADSEGGSIERQARQALAQSRVERPLPHPLSIDTYSLARP